jgi:hypothetical protein
METGCRCPKRGLEAVAQLVQRIADLFLLLLRHVFELREEAGDEAALAAEVADAQVVERAGVVGGIECRVEVGTGFGDFVEHKKTRAILARVSPHPKLSVVVTPASAARRGRSPRSR